MTVVSFYMEVMTMKKIGKRLKKQLIKAAKELGYNQEVIAKLEAAETENEAYKIMEQARLTAD